jgi:signal transduction histidine kinase
MVHLSIHDDGRGFAAPPAGPRPAVSPQAGYGLDGIAERVRLLGGVVQVRSAPGQGTTVEVRVPGLV